MLKHSDPNPLNVHQMRRLDYCPPHFVPVAFSIATNEKVISDWIWENLEGRFYYGDSYDESAEGAMIVQKVVAFEMAGEASYFALILDTINTYEYIVN